jgi:hypothetical protein
MPLWIRLNMRRNWLMICARLLQGCVGGTCICRRSELITLRSETKVNNTLFVGPWVSENERCAMDTASMVYANRRDRGGDFNGS